MTDRQITHAPGCWGWGPRHYECAVREIERLAARLTAETSNALGEWVPGEGEEIMVNTPYDVFILPLRPSGLDGNGPRFVVHVPGPEQPAAMAPPPGDGCHCGTCTCNPNMTPAVRFDLSPAQMEGAIRDHLIALGWTPPDTAPTPSAPVGVEEMQRRLDREESDHERTIAQRDAAEDALGRMFQAVTGRPAEWSSTWGYVDAIEEVEEHVAALAQQPAAFNTAAAPVHTQGSVEQQPASEGRCGVKFWFGQRGWGWRLWGVSYGDQWFIGLSIKQQGGAE